MRRGLRLAAVVALGLSASGAAEERFVAPLPPEAAVEARTGLVYSHPEARELAFDLYLPAERSGPVPVVVFLNGIGADWLRGHPQYEGWARAVTARGLAGVTMDSREGSVEVDLRKLLDFLRAHRSDLGVDPSRLALWSCSANAKVGVPLSQSLDGLAAAVVYYGSGEVAGFRRDRPMLFVRAGLDGAELNRGIDALVGRALADNAPVELLNVAGAPHGFDLFFDSEVSRAAIASTLEFLQRALSGNWSGSVAARAPRAAAASAVYREDWSSAAAAYEALLRVEEDDAVAWEGLGRARVASGDEAGAIAAFERALDHGTKNRGRVSFELVRLRTRSGEIDRAFETLEGMRRWLRFFTGQLANDPDFAPLRADPRLAPLLEEAGPPPG